MAPFTVDKGLSLWDQNRATPPMFNRALPFGCTGMTQAGNLSDQYGQTCRPEYTYDWTCYMENHDDREGCDLRTSMKSTQIYGAQFVGEKTAEEAQRHRGGQYFNIYDDGKLDWFDGVLTAVRAQLVGASIGTPWFASWGRVGSDGILPMPTKRELAQAKDSPFSLPWHNWAVKGLEQRGSDGVWQVSAHVGRWLYMPRDVANTVLEIRGAGAFIQPKYAPKDLYTIKLAILEYEVRYMLRIFGLLLN